MSSRRLSLHVSALNDEEYKLYNDALSDLALDSTNTSVGVREVRAWMRGRFGALESADVDTILKMFSPTLAPADTLSPGQFYAAVRLAVHVDGGQAVDKALAFVQARPKSPSNRSHSPIRAPSPGKSSHPPPPQRSQSQRVASSHRNKSNPFTPSPSLSAGSTPPILPPRKAAPVPPPPPRSSFSAAGSTSSIHTPHVTTTLMKQSLQASKTGQTMKNAERMLEKERIMQVLKSSSQNSHATTPGNDGSGFRRAPSPTKTSSSNGGTSTSQHHEAVAPPLPRRKGVDAVSSSSLEQVAAASLASTNGRPPPPPAKPAFLSSNSSAPPRPPPLHSTPSSSSSPSPTQPLSDTVSSPPPTHPDRLRNRVPSSSSSGQYASYHHPSASLDSPRSANSFEAIYGTGTSSPFDRPLATAPLQGLGTPRALDSSASTPPPRIFRSKSLHVSNSPSSSADKPPVRSVSGRKPPVPPPLSASGVIGTPPPRRRPETLHFLPSPTSPDRPGAGAKTIGAGAGKTMGANALAGLRSVRTRGEMSPESDRRRSSRPREDGEDEESPFSDPFSSSTQSSPHHQPSPRHQRSSPSISLSNAESHIQRTLNKLTLAKYKAEAGIMAKRGFVQGQGLDGVEWEREREEKMGLMGGGERLVDDKDSPFSNGAGVSESRRKLGNGRSRSVIDSDDDDSDEGEMGGRGMGNGPAGTIRGRGVERDSMKWPVQPGEGWTAL